MRHRSAPQNRPLQKLSRALAHDAGARSIAPASKMHFKIDRITCKGYSAADQRRFTLSLRSNLFELAQRHDGNTWCEAAGLVVERLNAGSLRSGASPEETARQIAAIVIGRLTKRQTP